MKHSKFAAIFTIVFFGALGAMSSLVPFIGPILLAFAMGSALRRIEWSRPSLLQAYIGLTLGSLVTHELILALHPATLLIFEVCITAVFWGAYFWPRRQRSRAVN